MKSFQVLKFAVVLLVAGATISGCQKDKNKESNCQLVAANFAADSAGSSYTFTYNSNNKITQIVSTGDNINKTLAYSGNTVEIINRESSQIQGKTVLTLNSEGRIIRQEDRDPVSNQVENVSDYTYSASGELTSVSNKYGNSQAQISTLTNTNGNITIANNNGQISTFEYLEDQPQRAGDYFDLLQRLNMGNNFSVFNKNLLKRIQDQSSTTEFSYTYDENNNISSLTIKEGNNIEKVNYKYDCK